MSAPMPVVDPARPGDLDVFRLRRCRHGLMAFLAADDTIGRALDLYGEFAESENQVMSLLLQGGDTAIDVGANVGTVSLALAQGVGPSGTVWAFEPQRLVFQALCATLTLNDLTHVRAHHAAVGRTAGMVRVPALDPRRPANFGGVRIGGPGESDLVPLLTIDALQLLRCKLLKIDAEGMDYDVLLGAAATVERTRPHIYLEAQAQPATALALAWLQERNYRCYWHFAGFFAPDNYNRVAENIFGGRGDVNVLALPAETGLQPTLPFVTAPDNDWRQAYEAYQAGQGAGA
jgi:FkbM family methyltransferase